MSRHHKVQCTWPVANLELWMEGGAWGAEKLINGPAPSSVRDTSEGNQRTRVMPWSSSWGTWSSPQGSCLGLHGTGCPDSHPLSGSWKLSWVFDLYWLQQSCLKTKEDVNTSRNTWHIEVNISQTRWPLDPENISDFLCPMSLSLILWIAEINYFVMCFVNPRK